MNQGGAAATTEALRTLVGPTVPPLAYLREDLFMDVRLLIRACIAGLDLTEHPSEQTMDSTQSEAAPMFFCEGRRPLGHIEAKGHPCGLAQYLARCAHLEAASVVAFEQLAIKLRLWGAPTSLVDRCWRAADDEVVHARRVGALARRRGATIPEAEQRPGPIDPVQLTMDNAVEGCVHEAWAALRAAWVARHAPDPEVRELYTEIADDEARHAQLSWDLHQWLLEQLDETERERVDVAQRRAIAQLPQIAAAQARQTPTELGMPPLAPSMGLATHFGEGLALAA